MSEKWVRQAAILMAGYLALAFAYSFIGFVVQQPTIHFREYSFPEAVLEISGHFTFGVLAAIPLKEAKASLTAGGLAVAIDIDHLLGTLNLSVSSRPDHSIAFTAIASLFIFYLVRTSPTLGSAKGPLATSSLVPISMLSHVSYDILAAYLVFHGIGYSFPVLIPFDYQLFGFPLWSFAVFEAVAVGLAYLVGRKKARS